MSPEFLACKPASAAAGDIPRRPAEAPFRWPPLQPMVSWLWRESSHARVTMLRRACLVVLLFAGAFAASAKPRARDVGIPFDGTPGPLNAITDVVGVEVGHVTLMSGEGKLQVGRGPVRTGVTAILPRGRDFKGRVFAARH